MDRLRLAQVRAARMASLLLDHPEARTPLEVVRWFGAMQAQDAASGHWSVGLRCPGSTEADVLGAFERAEILRTWPMRGTIHIVPARDAGWMLALTGPRALDGSARRRDQLGLRPQDLDQAVKALIEALADHPLLTRSEALEAIERAGVITSGQRGYHLLWYAAQIGVIAIGPQRGPDQTFVLLADWAPVQVPRSRDDALAELLFRYVRSHGPVSLRDFAGWTGLTLTDARAAADLNDGRLRPVDTEAGPLWATCELAGLVERVRIVAHPVVALPGFDEFLLGYKDRTLQLPQGAMERIVPGGNGVFRPTVVVDGRVVATWRRTMRGTRVDVEVEPLASRLTAAQRGATDDALARYGRFVRRPLRVTVKANDAPQRP